MTVIGMADNIIKFILALVLVAVVFVILSAACTFILFALFAGGH